ncbi:MAG: fatty acid--CoA ligase family protein [Pseudotabrizicola sp.]|uniref:class I adenylate-forming enzyme family protein n=1 Tax=Pseudotabrizicola sp. TaxID=2939647 RepID=UPI0027177DB7|nr:fatty acid--CoA ligase family protein [Pseudotabrizicola sp.]MDO9640119.1 fatty acid--CoA ligase family protein [Pseudotabrizicola sp.]
MSHGAAFAPEVADRPGGTALVAALAGQGAGFRIGGEGAVEAGSGCFETLTGGSLGGARRVVRSQGSWLASFAVNARLFGIGPGVRVAVPGRLSQSLALYAALEGLALGACVHLLDGLRVDRMARAVAERGTHVIYATPVHLAQMVACGVVWPDLRLVLVGGAKLEAGLRVALMAVAPGAEVREFYGAAEASFITLAGPGDGAETVGRPYPGVELRIRDGEGRDLPAGAVGQVWLRSPYVFQRYAGDDPGSARWHEGWLCVGEIGALTPAGLVLRGRAGRMVTVAGQNVFPEEIERFLAGLPGVERAAVLARADGLRGHVLMAVLTGDRACEGEIMAAARARLGATLAPRRVIWRQDWPVLGSGKTDLGVLQREVDAWR